jgi:hypothetical protein
MKNFILMLAAALTTCIGASHAQEAKPATATANTQSTGPGLSDLDTMTFECPKAALNIAAREAARAPSQGTYQFSYFNIVHDAHHAAYEVHFKSNYQGEPTLKYCVSMYCQQGWDPKTSKAEVTLMNNERRRGKAVHAATCGAHAGTRKR